MLKNLPQYVANARKALINAIGLLTSLLSLGILVDPLNKYVATTLAVLTLLVHYVTPNADAPGNSPAEEEFDPLANDEDLGESIPEEFEPANFVTAGQIAAEKDKEAPPDI